jgi:choline dehydrogenase
VPRPDLQIYFLPGVLKDNLEMAMVHGYQASCLPLQCSSRGYLKLRSTDPREHPIIQPNYLSTEDDRLKMRRGIKLTREVFAQRAFDDFRGEELSPTRDVQSDAEIDAWVREHAETSFHPACTNRMGVDAATSVVDPETRVHGLEGLRVVDASIMPSVVSGNLNAPTIMIAERAADLILGNAPLSPEDEPVYESPNWKTSQR